MDKMKVIALASFFLSLLLFILCLQFFSVIASASIFIISIILFVMLGVLYLRYQKEKQRQKIEGILPEYLMLVAGNIKSGMSPVLALKHATRPEFSPLSEEISYAVNKSLGTDSFIEALFKIPQKFGSEILNRVMALFVTGQLSGGDLPRMLEGLAVDIRENEQIKKQVSLGVDIYLIFLMFSMVVGMPLLFGVSFTFLSAIKGLDQLQSIDLTLLFWILAVYLILTSLIVGGFIGLIKKGSIVSGLDQGLVIAVISAVVFYLIIQLFSFLFVF